MALALSLEKLDGVDPAIAALYVEKDGKFTLDVEGLEDTSALKAALKTANKEAHDRRIALEKLKDMDPEEYARLKKEAEEREAKKLEDKGEFEKLREKWQKDMNALEEKYKGFLGEKDALLSKHVKDSAVRNAALKAGVIPEDIEDVMTITAKYFKLADDGALQVLDEAGEVTPKTVDEFFAKDFKERKPKFYAASGNTGGGAGGGAGGGGGPGNIRTRADLKTPKEKAAYIEKHGLEAFKKLPAK